MTDLITTKAEIKAYLGISGTSQDAMINLWNKTATEILADMLKVERFGVHTVSDELVKPMNPYYLVLNDFPVDTGETITLKDSLLNTITGYSFALDPHSKRRLLLKDSNGQPKDMTYEEVYASYTAGYTTQGSLTVVDASSGALLGNTIITKAAGVETTYTFVSGTPGDNEIQRQDGTDTMATNIANAIGGTASGAVVTLPIGMEVDLGTVVEAAITIVDATIPEALKVAVALIVGGSMTEATTKRGGVTSYTLGSKSVTFADTGSRNLFAQIVDQYLGDYKRVTLRAI